MSLDVPVTLDEVQALVTEEGLQYSRDEIKNAFSLLMQKGFVVINGHGKSTIYLLSDPTRDSPKVVDYHSRMVDR